MISHVRKTACPICRREICIVPPGVAIKGIAAPRGFGDMIIQVDVDLLLCSFGSNRIINLKTCSAVAKRGIIRNHTLKHTRPILHSQRIRKGRPDRHIRHIVVVDLINQLGGIGETNRVHAQTFDFGDNAFNGLVLKTLGDHGLCCAWPVCAGIGHVVVACIEDPGSRCGEGAVGPWLLHLAAVLCGCCCVEYGELSGQEGEDL